MFIAAFFSMAKKVERTQMSINAYTKCGTATHGTFFHHKINVDPCKD